MKNQIAKKKNERTKSPRSSVKTRQTIVVSPERFIYLREPDYILAIIVDNTEIYDYKSKKKIKLDDYNIGIIIDDGFIPIETFLILNEKNGTYKSKIIRKIEYRKKLVKYPPNDKFRLSIDSDGNISPNVLTAKIQKIDHKKKNIDLTIRKFYEIDIF